MWYFGKINAYVERVAIPYKFSQSYFFTNTPSFIAFSFIVYRSARSPTRSRTIARFTHATDRTERETIRIRIERKRAGSWRDGKSPRQWLPYIDIAGPDNEARGDAATPCRRRRRFRRCKWHLRNAVKAVKGGLLPAGLTFDLCHLSFLFSPD